jgi:hypothetical protein
MRFTIRDVLWLTVVVALAAGWWIDRQRTAGISAAEMGRQAWQFETVAAVLEKHDGITVSGDPGGVLVKFPNGDAVYYVVPDHLRSQKSEAKAAATPNRP